MSGNYDLIAIGSPAANEELVDPVATRMHGIKEILKTETMLAFKASSKRDLHAAFAVGNGKSLLTFRHTGDRF